MKFRIVNPTLPPINSTILICRQETNIIGIVENIIDDYIVVLMLDRNGKIVIKKTDEWIPLTITDLQSLRYNYKSFINGNINNIIKTSYDKFSSNYIKK